MGIKHIILVITSIVMPANLLAQGIPEINPTATYTDASGQEEVSNAFSGSAPLVGNFAANPKNTDGWSATYEWVFYTEGNAASPFLTRFDQDTQYTFTQAGTNYIALYATFTQGTDTIEYTKDYWDQLGPMSVTVSTSILEMPNAFSPNGDGINDVYKAKDGYQSIVEFHAYIFNRWGQKLYEWTDPSGGWDGKYNGKDVAEGVYFVLVKAKGADGINYNIKRDVNLLRGYADKR